MKEKNLSILFKYYKEGKVTEFTLCSEIEDYLSTNLRTKVEIAKGSSSTSYIVAFLPIKTDVGYKVKYIIDKAALDTNFISDDDIVACLDNLKDAEQQILMAFHKELSVMKYNEVGLSELLASYLKIFRMGQSVLPYSVKEKAIKNKILDTSLVDSYIEKLETYSERLSVIIEELGVKKVVPAEFIDAAKNLISYQVERRVVVGDPGVPNLNQLNTLLGHDASVDDIFSGGIEIKEPLHENEDLKKN